MTCAAAAWVTLVITNPSPTWGTPKGLDHILAGVPSRIVLPVRNNALRSIRIQSVQTTCGCVEIRHAPTRLPPLASRDIVLEATVDPANPLLHQWVAVVFDSGYELQYLIQGEAIPIVPGWPKVAYARRSPTADASGNEFLSIPINEPYREHIRTVTILDGSDEEIPSMYDRKAARIVTAIDHREPSLLALSIRDADIPDWVAPIVVRADADENGEGT